MKILGYVLLFIVFIGFLAGAYQLAKWASYEIWYKSMVEQTIKRTVKQDCLILNSENDR